MLRNIWVTAVRCRGISYSAAKLNNSTTYEPENHEPMIPPFEEKFGEPLKLKKARLVYQSRKRGMLENGILLSTFADKYLQGFDSDQTREYDRLINLPSNDWDIFYWATGVKPTPEEFNTPVMNMFKDFIKNHERELRIRQPDLKH